ncbi:hypothetical protein C7B61_14220, partial [filamentous cyanobacterium CCP1]
RSQSALTISFLALPTPAYYPIVARIVTFSGQVSIEPDEHLAESGNESEGKRRSVFVMQDGSTELV